MALHIYRSWTFSFCDCVIFYTDRACQCNMKYCGISGRELMGAVLTGLARWGQQAGQTVAAMLKQTGRNRKTQRFGRLLTSDQQFQFKSTGFWTFRCLVNWIVKHRAYWKLVRNRLSEELETGSGLQSLLSRITGPKCLPGHCGRWMWSFFLRFSQSFALLWKPDALDNLENLKNFWVVFDTVPFPICALHLRRISQDAVTRSDEFVALHGSVLKMDAESFCGWASHW